MFGPFGEEPSWPPSPEDLYLPPNGTRPVFQGDVFKDVPFVKARSAGDPNRDPNTVIERRLVAVVGYTCDIYEKGRLVKVQTVAPVINATKRGVPENWDGAFNLFPLPNLLGDGALYAVDFRAMSNIDSSYLQRGNRLKSLSRRGWSLFLMRFVLSSTRGLVPLSVWEKIGAGLWEEVDLWDQWCVAGGDEAGFQAWLDEVCAHLGGFTRRQLLQRGLLTQVVHDLNEAITSFHHPIAPDKDVSPDI